MHCRLSLLLSADVYNRGVRAWEPAVEPWRLHATAAMLDQMPIQYPHAIK
jgi:hypothetical protein